MRGYSPTDIMNANRLTKHNKAMVLDGHIEFRLHEEFEVACCMRYIVQMRTP